MKITLRRAASLQTAIRETIGRLAVADTVSVSIFADIAQERERAVAAFHETVRRRTALQDVLFSIRRQVGEANMSCGISALLNEQAANAARIEFFRPLAAARPAEDMSVVMRRAKRQEAREDGVRGWAGIDQEAVPVGLLSETDILGYDQDLRDAERRKVAISDALAEANSSNHIDLDETQVDVLTREKLI